MTRAVRLLIAVALATSVVGPLAAQGPDLNLKPGLWEMTMTIDMGGPPPGTDASKFTPEQQAQMMAMMRGRGNAPRVVKNCMTKEKLAAHKYMEDRPGETCKRTVTKSTSTALDVTQVCTAAGTTTTTTSELHIEAPSNTSVIVTAKQSGGRMGPISVTSNGKWVATDCGTVK